MSQSIIELDSRHPVPVGASKTISVYSGDTVYYGNDPQVSASSNLGSLTFGGASVTPTGATWVLSASSSTLLVVDSAPASLVIATSPQTTFAGTDGIGSTPLGLWLANGRSPGASSQVSMFDQGQGTQTSSKVGIWSRGAAGAIVIDATDFKAGVQSVKYTTDNLSTVGAVNSDIIGPLDWSTKIPRFLVKVSDITRIKELTVMVSADAAGFTNFAKAAISPVLSSQSGSPSSILNNDEWRLVTIPRGQFNATGGTGIDWTQVRQVRFRVVDWSTGAFDFHLQQVDAITDNTGTGIVSIVMDDGRAAQYTLARPILENAVVSAGVKLSLPVTLYLLADSLGASGAYMTLAQVRDWTRYGNAIACAHAYWNASGLTTHSLTNGFKDLTSAQAEEDLLRLKQFLASNGFRGHSHLAWPKGYYNDTLTEIARKYFISAADVFHSSASSPAVAQYETFPPADPMKLRRWSVDGSGGTSSGGVPTDTAAAVTAVIDLAIAQKCWVILNFHNFYSSGAAGASTDYYTGDFTTIANYVASKVGAGTLRCMTVPDVLAQSAP